MIQTASRSAGCLVPLGLLVRLTPVGSWALARWRRVGCCWRMWCCPRHLRRRPLKVSMPAKRWQSCLSSGVPCGPKKAKSLPRLSPVQNVRPAKNSPPGPVQGLNLDPIKVEKTGNCSQTTSYLHSVATVCLSNSPWHWEFQQPIFWRDAVSCSAVICDCVFLSILFSNSRMSLKDPSFCCCQNNLPQ